MFIDLFIAALKTIYLAIITLIVTPVSAITFLVYATIKYGKPKNWDKPLEQFSRLFNTILAPGRTKE